jgi:hypothetical protein
MSWTLLVHHQGVLQLVLYIQLLHNILMSCINDGNSLVQSSGRNYYTES